MSEEKPNTHNVLVPISNAGGGFVRQLLTLALDGNPVLPSARKSASGHLDRTGNHDSAIDALVVQHVAMAGAQGFVTNLGGLVAAVVGIPANITGSAIVALRVVGAIAHLRGYNIDDPRVRSAVMLTMVKSDPGFTRLALKTNLPDSPMLVATAPAFDEALDHRISEALLKQIALNVGGRRAASLVGRQVPILGGGVGLVVDSYFTWQISRLAKECFVARRVANKE